MSTRRFFPVLAQQPPLPVWIYGNDNGVANMIGFSDGSIILQNFDYAITNYPKIYLGYGPSGAEYATTDSTIQMTAATEAHAMGLLIAPSGIVNSTLLGTFLTPSNASSSIKPLTSIVTVSSVAQYAALPTDAIGVTVAGVNHLMASGFFSYYYQSTVSTACGHIAQINMVTGAINTGFTGLVLTGSGSLNSYLSPLLYSDGAGNFGLFSVSGWAFEISYVQSFNGLPAGVGNSLSSSPAVAGTYGGTNFSGPFSLNANGTFGALWASGKLSMARPYSMGGGIFIQDAEINRGTTTDPTGPVGSITQTCALSYARASNQITIMATNSFTSSAASVGFVIEGGSAGAAAIGSFAYTGGFLNSGQPAALAAFIAGTLFPDCTYTFADSSTSFNVSLSIVVTLPTNANYYCNTNTEYRFYTTTGWVNVCSIYLPHYLWIGKSDNSVNYYYPLSTQAGIGAVVSPISCSAIAVNGGVICHVLAWQKGTGLNSQKNWTITLPGIKRINVSLAAGNAINDVFVKGTSSQQVSVVPFGSGFAIALPFTPSATSSWPPDKFTWSPAVASATTSLLSCPVMVIDAAGNINTAFDAAAYANFFALNRADNRRYGPISLIVNSFGNLLFGSYYTPTYLSLSAAAPTPADNLGNQAVPPVLHPLSAPGIGFTPINPTFENQEGPGYEVLCCTNSAGAKVQPS